MVNAKNQRYNCSGTGSFNKLGNYYGTENNNDDSRLYAAPEGVSSRLTVVPSFGAWGTDTMSHGYGSGNGSVPTDLIPRSVSSGCCGNRSAGSSDYFKLQYAYNQYPQACDVYGLQLCGNEPIGRACASKNMVPCKASSSGCATTDAACASCGNTGPPPNP